METFTNSAYSCLYVLSMCVASNKEVVILEDYFTQELNYMKIPNTETK